MSSLFSYELDEKQIRSTLQNSKEVNYSDSSWDDFETNFVQQSSNQSHTKFKLPEFHLNINRNVVLPVIFIAGLVGVSAIMLSFVDFKTNTPAQVEKGLVPNPDNYKPEKIKTAVIVKKEEVKQPVEKPIVKPDSVFVKTETPPVLTPTQVAVIPNAINHTIASNNTQNNNASRTVIPDTTKTSPTIISPLGQNNRGKKRKRRRKVPTDQIETIKAPSLLGQQEAAGKEPEMELKLN